MSDPPRPTGRPDPDGTSGAGPPGDPGDPDRPGDPHGPGTPPGPGGRLRTFVGRTRRVPATVDGLADQVADAQHALAALRAAAHDLEALAWATRDDVRGGVTAVGDALHDRANRVDTALHDLARSVADQAATLHRAVAAPARRAAARALVEARGPAPELRPGLSVFTLCWNHASLLPHSVRSALAVLDRLPPEEQGRVLVLDDGSSDATPEVAAELAAADPRVEVIRSEANLGLALARNVLLHVAGTSHALQLDADNTAVPDGVAALYRAARQSGAAITYGTIARIDHAGRPLGPASNEPPSSHLSFANYVDTLAVTDVAAFRHRGGWLDDPLLEHVDDWTAVRRAMATGQLIAFVPVLAGRYRVLDTAFNLTVGDLRPGRARVNRVFDPTGVGQGPDGLDGVAAVALHPEIGVLWATPAAVALRPDLRPGPAGPLSG